MRITYPFTLVYTNDYDREFEMRVTVDYDKPMHLITDDFVELMEEADLKAEAAQVDLTDYTLEKILVGGAVIVNFGDPRP